MLGELSADLAKQEARWIVEHVSGWKNSDLPMHEGDVVPNPALLSARSLCKRRQAGEPLQYVLGSWAFRSLELFVDRRVLIPRFETEVLTGLAIEHARKLESATVVDLGTGSGAIAFSLAAEVESARVHATDMSIDALAVARANLAGIGSAATRVTLHHGDWFSALPIELKGAVDVLVSNPPYVALGDVLPREVSDWEPAAALFAADNGRQGLRSIIECAPEWLSLGGFMDLEMAPEQTQWAAQLCEDIGLSDVEVVVDLSGLDRFVVARLGSVTSGSRDG